MRVCRTYPYKRNHREIHTFARVVLPPSAFHSHRFSRPIYSIQPTFHRAYLIMRAVGTARSTRVLRAKRFVPRRAATPSHTCTREETEDFRPLRARNESSSNPRADPFTPRGARSSFSRHSYASAAHVSSCYLHRSARMLDASAGYIYILDSLSATRHRDREREREGPSYNTAPLREIAPPSRSFGC